MSKGAKCRLSAANFRIVHDLSLSLSLSLLLNYDLVGVVAHLQTMQKYDCNARSQYQI
jgi:hypothetical protein